MFKMDLEKAEEPEIKLPTSVGSSKKQDSSRKTSTSALLTMPKPLTVWITANWTVNRATELNYVLHSVSMCVIVSENLNNWFWFLWVFSPWIMNPPIMKTFMSLNHYMFEIYSCYKKWQIIVWKPVNKTWKYILENNNDSKHLGV